MLQRDRKCSRISYSDWRNLKRDVMESRTEMTFGEKAWHCSLQRVLAHVWLIQRSRYNRAQYHERAARKSGVHGVETNRVRNRKCIWPASHAAGLSPNRHHENTGIFRCNGQININISRIRITQMDTLFRKLDNTTKVSIESTSVDDL